MADEYPEVTIETPYLTVTVKSATSLGEATAAAEKLFDKYRPTDTRLGPAGFAQVERRGVPEVQSGTMPMVPRDFPER